ncbi:MAG TPA: CAP domain-containing protein [Propionicimonas sp.]|nr:CAP domain-containing protein [Propionicimonas sp.]
MRRRLLRHLTACLTGLALTAGLVAVATVPAQAASFGVTIQASLTTVLETGTVTFTGKVSPRPSSRTLYLQRRYPGSSTWTSVKKFTAASDGSYSVKTGFADARDRYFRVYKPKSSTRKAGRSASVKIVVNSPAEPLAGGKPVRLVVDGVTGATRVTVTPRVPADYVNTGVGLSELPATFTVINDNTIDITPPASLGGTNLVKVYTPSGTVETSLLFGRTSRVGSSFEKAVLDQVNLRRSKTQTCRGTRMPAVGKLAWDGQLSDLALSHARDLAARQGSAYEGLDHVTHGLKAFYHRFYAAGYTSGGSSENLALSPQGYSASQVVTQWMKSTSGHCESVMSKSWKKAGIGVASGRWGSQPSIFTNLDLR